MSNQKHARGAHCLTDRPDVISDEGRQPDGDTQSADTTLRELSRALPPLAETVRIRNQQPPATPATPATGA